jgi:hypothetical protein
MKKKIDIEFLKDLLIDYLFNQGVTIGGKDYWCILEASDAYGEDGYDEALKEVIDIVFEILEG